MEKSCEKQVLMKIVLSRTHAYKNSRCVPNYLSREKNLNPTKMLHLGKTHSVDHLHDCDQLVLDVILTQKEAEDGVILLA